MRQKLIGAGFSLLGATGLHRLAAPGLRGLGAILMFHHVRPPGAQPFGPNGLLEITPAFLEAVVIRLRKLGYEIVTLDQAVTRLRTPMARGTPFAVLTFDDGYRDNVEYALPLLEKHAAPFTIYIATGFADRSAHLWWTELEEAVRRAPAIEVVVGTETLKLPASTLRQKQAAFEAIYSHLRKGSEEQLHAVLSELCAATGIDRPALVRERCLDWDEILRLSGHPLATIGAHTLTHPRLAKLDDASMMAEIGESRTEIETRLGRKVHHLAYPVGDPTSAGAREFAAALSLGFTTAVTTRPGLIFGEHAEHLTALPRLSVNGNWQDLRNIEVLLSGAAFALWNRGRRVNAA